MPRRRPFAVLLFLFTLGAVHACVGDAPDANPPHAGIDAGQVDGTAPGNPEAGEDGGVIAIGKSRLAMGSHHACVVTPAGDVYCWGAGGLGQLGVTRAALGCESADSCARAVPGMVPLSTRATGVSAGDNATCVVDTAGAAWCFGLNERGQLGFTAGGDTCGPIAACSETPRKVVSEPPEDPLPPFATISVGAGWVLALSEKGVVHSWGQNPFGEAGRPPSATRILPPGRALAPLDGNVRQIATSIHHLSLAVHSRRAMSWGGDGLELALGRDPPDTACDGGPLRDEAAPSRDRCDEVAAAVGPGLSGNVLEVHAGYNIGFARTSAGQLWAWGKGSSGTMMRADPRAAYYPLPRLLIDGGVEQVGYFAYFGCYLSRGKLLCWGNNSAGQTGAAANDECAVDGGPACVMTPRAVNLPADVVDFAVGRAAVLALLVDGRLFAWGDNTFSALGHPAGTEGDVRVGDDVWAHPEPTQVQGLAPLR